MRCSDCGGRSTIRIDGILVCQDCYYDDEKED